LKGGRINPGGRQRSAFFRGSELSRLLLLGGVTVVGWALVIFWPQPAPPPVAKAPPLPPPDDSAPFQGLIDRTQMTPRDNAAYAALLAKVRQTPHATLAAESRRDVLFSQLIENPERYRGLPIHVEGTLLRVIRQDVQGSSIYPDGVYYEGYAVSPDSQNNPWVLAFEHAPPRLEGGNNLYQRITFDGYFLKLWAYQAGDRFRVAPLLIGRFPPAAAPGAPWWSGLDERMWPLLVLVALSAYLGLRLMIQLRKRPRPVARPRGDLPQSDRIDPEALTAWIEGQARPGEAAEGQPRATDNGPDLRA
jgi:hypothetical protein